MNKGFHLSNWLRSRHRLVVFIPWFTSYGLIFVAIILLIVSFIANLKLVFIPVKQNHYSGANSTTKKH